MFPLLSMTIGNAVSAVRAGPEIGFAPLFGSKIAPWQGQTRSRKAESYFTVQPWWVQRASQQPIPFEVAQEPEFHMGGGGLYGTAADYLKFTQMILNQGRANGHQLLKPETVALMGQNHIGELNVTKLNSAIAFATNDVDLYPGMDKKWGLSFLINTETTPEGRSPNSLAWAGLANTYFWIDPARDISGVILMQVLPFGDAKCLDAFAAERLGDDAEDLIVGLAVLLHDLGKGFTDPDDLPGHPGHERRGLRLHRGIIFRNNRRHYRIPLLR